MAGALISQESNDESGESTEFDVQKVAFLPPSFSDRLLTWCLMQTRSGCDVNETTPREYEIRLCRAIDYINQNLASNPSVEEIARAAPFSKFHFQRLFRAVLGESVAEFTRRLRLESAARQILFAPSRAITDIALEFGFSSSQNFAKAFRKRFGVSPTQFRREKVHGKWNRQLAHRPTDDMIADGFQFGPSGSCEDTASLQVEIKPMPARQVVYVRHFGSYRAPGLEQAFSQLERWAEQNGLEHAGPYLGIPWDSLEITQDQQCRFDACLVVHNTGACSGEVNIQTVPRGSYAVYHCQVQNHDFELPWTRIMHDWLPTSGYQPADGPRFEVYHNDGRDDPAGRWDLDVCLPVKPL